MVRNNQNRRSMIEILGVLAIVGILSVGAVFGYNKALLNINLISRLSNFIR